MRTAIVGCGLIGQKRAGHLAPGSVKIACDLNLERAEKLAERLPGCRPSADPILTVTSGDVDVVMIATLNDSLAQIAEIAIKAGKHVLVEKPAALESAVADRLEGLAAASGVQVRVGYNHRYHPACIRAQEIIASGVIGSLMFLRARYGHGGRVGYDREWRADPALSGGGELIDQGVHLIDLAGLFLGAFTEVDGHADTFFWDMPVDDNAFISLRTATGQTAWLHASCSEWKNLFSMEIYGRNGKLHWEGLGGSYGLERLTHYQMLPAMGPPDTVIYEYPRGDLSWKIEMDEFSEDIRLGRTPVPGLKEARTALQVVESIYQKSGFISGRRAAANSQ
jgi:predicted dehydrogenase